MTSSTYGRRVARNNQAFRRSVTVVLLSLVLPGSAQIILGRKPLGRAILKTYLALVGLAVVAILIVGLLALIKRDWAVWLSVHVGFGTSWLEFLRWAVLLIAVAWAAVVVHAYVLSHPPSIGGRRRLVATLVTVAVAATILVPAWWISSLAKTQHDLVANLFASGTAELGDRVNILLIGGDAGDDRIGLRSDSMTVASVDTSSGRAVLFSLPRNMEGVPFPADSPLHNDFPDGFRCADDQCLLNGVYAYAVEHAKLFPEGMSAEERGTSALRDAVGETLGLDIPYYVLVDLAGFENIVNALGGVTINVQTRVPIGGNADNPNAPVEGYIEPGLQTLDGHEALWYGRSRTGASDYLRMQRQRCLMGAILREADPATVLRKYKDLASAAESTIATNIKQGILPALVTLALRTKAQPLVSVQFVPPLIPNTADPDFDLIRSTVDDTISAAEDAPDEIVTTLPADSGGSDTDTDDGTAGGAVDPDNPASSGDGAPVNVDEVCSYT